MKSSIKVLYAIALVVASASASAASLGFNFTDGINIGSFSVNTTNIGTGTEWATTGTLTVTGGADIGTYTLVPIGPTATTPPLSVFTVNNLVYTTGNQYFDVFGLLFAADSSGAVPQFNIYGTAPGSYYFDYSGNDAGSASLVTVTPTPIPGAIWMVGSALIGGFGFMRRKLA